MTGQLTVRDGYGREYEVCCDVMAQSFRDGTDNEEYEQLSRIVDSCVTMGCNLPPINNCPWCGEGFTGQGLN